MVKLDEISLLKSIDDSVECSMMFVVSDFIGFFFENSVSAFCLKQI